MYGMKIKLSIRLRNSYFYRKGGLFMRCPFCPPILNLAQVILKNSICLFIQFPEPVLVGAGVIIPIQHRETLFDLIADEWEATFALLNQIKATLDEQYAPDGYNIGWNSGDRL
jgi:diadenosine tetraphosphate (Ap4A) HIT family hydrolase